MGKLPRAIDGSAVLFELFGRQQLAAVRRDGHHVGGASERNTPVPA